jgi:hypothetical protein
MSYGSEEEGIVFLHGWVLFFSREIVDSNMTVAIVSIEWLGTRGIGDLIPRGMLSTALAYTRSLYIIMPYLLKYIDSSVYMSNTNWSNLYFPMNVDS